jgi:hypothetical protein
MGAYPRFSMANVIPKVVRVGKVAALALTTEPGSVAWLSLEVEDPLRVIGEEMKSIKLGGRGPKSGVERRIDGSIDCQGTCSQEGDKKEEENSQHNERHRTSSWEMNVKTVEEVALCRGERRKSTIVMGSESFL